MKTTVRFVIGILSSALLTGAVHAQTVSASASASVSVGKAPPTAAIEHAQALSDAFAWVAEQVKPAVVTIVATKYITMPRSHMPFPFNFDFENRDNDNDDEDTPRRQRRGGRGGGGGGGEHRYEMEGVGSGVIIDADGYILTNNHVVKGMDDLKVIMADKRQLDAKVVGTDPKTDLAVIKIISKNHLAWAPLGNSNVLRVGDWVIAIGSPYKLPQTVTAGIVSAKGRQGLLDKNSYEDFIQTDAAINHGNSGGPLVNLHGEIVGINTAIYSESGANAGIGFSIPSAIIKQVLPSLRAGKAVARGQLGVLIQDLDEDMAKQFGVKETQGVIVAQVSKDSAAERAGVQSGDIITKFNGQQVQDVPDLRNRVAAITPGAKSTVTVLRKGREMTLNVTVGTAETTTATAAAEESEKPHLGMTVQNLTADLEKKLNYKGEKGVVVTDVEQDSAASRKGIREGDLIVEVNRQPVTSVSEFEKAVEIAKDAVLLLVKDKDGSRFVVLKKK